MEEENAFRRIRGALAKTPDPKEQKVRKIFKKIKNNEPVTEDEMEEYDRAMHDFYQQQFDQAYALLFPKG